MKRSVEDDRHLSPFRNRLAEVHFPLGEVGDVLGPDPGFFRQPPVNRDGLRDTEGLQSGGFAGLGAGLDPAEEKREANDERDK